MALLTVSIMTIPVTTRAVLSAQGNGQDERECKLIVAKGGASYSCDFFVIVAVADGDRVAIESILKRHRACERLDWNRTSGSTRRSRTCEYREPSVGIGI